MKISEVEPGMKIRVVWAPKSLTKPAKFVTVDVNEARFDHRESGVDIYSVRGIGTPEWGEGKYGSFRFDTSRAASFEVELV